MAFRNTELFDEIVEKALGLYGLASSGEAGLLQVSENAAYLIREKKEGKKLGVLRISRPGYHTLNELKSEMRWLEQINSEKCLIVPNPVKGIDYQTIQRVKGSDGQEYYCVLCDFLEGTPPNEEEGNAKQQFYCLGKITAYLHNQAESWQESKTLDRIEWNYDNMIGKTALWGPWQAARDMTPEIEELLTKTSKLIRRRLKDYGKNDSNYGLIHGDLRAANLLVEKGQMKIIDFDDCGFGWHLHDLASAFSFIETKPVVPVLMDFWLAGYQQIRSLTKKDIREIDTFMMLRRMQLMAWIASHYDSDPVKELGVGFTQGTVNMAEQYINKFG